ncbi:MAG: hypothetical protein H6573_22780 [Lewinellaceae bacterium]|nr:hypothetical protein [Lewinellaceae bacterium]
MMHQNLTRITIISLLTFCVGFFVAQYFCGLKGTTINNKENVYIQELILHKHLKLQLSLPIKNDSLAFITSDNLFRLYANEGYWYLYPSLESFFEKTLIGEIDISQKIDANLEVYGVEILKKESFLVESYKKSGLSFLIGKYLEKAGRNDFKLIDESNDLEELGTIVYIMNINDYFAVINERNSSLFFTKFLSKD